MNLSKQERVIMVRIFKKALGNTFNGFDNICDRRPGRVKTKINGLSDKLMVIINEPENLEDIKEILVEEGITDAKLIYKVTFKSASYLKSHPDSSRYEANRNKERFSLIADKLNDLIFKYNAEIKQVRKYAMFKRCLDALTDKSMYNSLNSKKYLIRDVVRTTYDINKSNVDWKNDILSILNEISEIYDRVSYNSSDVYLWVGCESKPSTAKAGARLLSASDI